jgi:hypothetical protein
VTITRTGVPANFVFPTGTTTIIYTATDAAGNQSTGVQLVTVTESPAVPPTITAPANVTAYTGPGATSCGTVVSDATLGTPTAADNCSLASVTRTGVPAGNVFPVGTTIVTYRATDASGNFREATQSVTVIDNTVPVVTPPAAVTAVYWCRCDFLWCYRFQSQRNTRDRFSDRQLPRSRRSQPQRRSCRKCIPAWADHSYLLSDRCSRQYGIGDASSNCGR